MVSVCLAYVCMWCVRCLYCAVCMCVSYQMTAVIPPSPSLPPRSHCRRKPLLGVGTFWPMFTSCPRTDCMWLTLRATQSSTFLLMRSLGTFGSPWGGLLGHERVCVCVVCVCVCVYECAHARVCMSVWVGVGGSVWVWACMCVVCQCVGM